MHGEAGWGITPAEGFLSFFDFLFFFQRRHRYLEQLAPCGQLLFGVERTAGRVKGLVAEYAARNRWERDAGGPELLGYHQSAEDGSIDLLTDGGKKVRGPGKRTPPPKKKHKSNKHKTQNTKNTKTRNGKMK